MCLVLAGLFFSRYLYRLNIITLGDFYRMRYNRTVEVLCTLAIVASYLGWVAAQIKALGLVFFVVTGGAISQPAGMILGAAIVLTYTTFGGMLSVAILDFVQMTVIMGGMLYIGYVIAGRTGGGGAGVSHAHAAGKLEFFPEATVVAWVPFIGAWITMMLGSIPQQDVFQRITSAKDEKTAVRGSVLVEKNKEYVQAARVIGLSPLLIMVRHVLPNVTGPVLVIATLNIGLAIISEATLSFLGVGLPSTQPSLGTLIRLGNELLQSGEWWITVFPGVTLAALVLAVNLLGDWLRDALNPKLR